MSSSLPTKTVRVSDARKLAIILDDILSRTTMKYDPLRGTYEYKMFEPLVMTKEVHDILSELLAKYDE